MEFKRDVWYKMCNTDTEDIWYVRNPIVESDLDRFTEIIHNGIYEKRNCNLGMKGHYKYKEIDNSEIKKYLPSKNTIIHKLNV